ncbi:MAG: prolipoprotein diacylglyceryl transferase [Bacteroidales bacterium]|nr:prolipoprotein diacylglyceryl transferase [Bacteroidales bacterium]
MVGIDINSAMLLNFITWDVDPEIFRVGVFSVRWYGLLFAAVFVLGYFIMRKIFRQEGIPVKVLDHLTWYMVFGTLIGARIGHCLFYEPYYYFENPAEIVQIWHGGLASHGAATGILAALFIFSQVEHRPYLWILDRMAIVVALSGFFIRMGNLVNSEIFGHPTGLPWGFRFVHSPEWRQPPINALPCHPTQIYEALAYLAIFAWLCRMYFRKSEKPYPGVLFGVFLVSLFTARFLVEFVKVDQVCFEKGMLLNMGQLLSIPFIILGIYMLIRPKPRPGISDDEWTNCITMNC